MKQSFVVFILVLLNFMCLGHSEAQITFTASEFEQLPKDIRTELENIETEKKRLLRDFEVGGQALKEFDLLLADYNEYAEEAERYFDQCERVTAIVQNYGKDSGVHQRYSQMVKDCQLESRKYEKDLSQDLADLKKIEFELEKVREVIRENGEFMALLEIKRMVEIRRGEAFLRRKKYNR